MSAALLPGNLCTNVRFPEMIAKIEGIDENNEIKKVLKPNRGRIAL